MAFGDASTEFRKQNQTQVGGFGSAARAFVDKRIKDDEDEKERLRREQIMRDATPTLNLIREVSKRRAPVSLGVNNTAELQQISERGTTLTRPVGAEISAAKPSLGSKIRNVLPESVAERVYDPIAQGLMGDPELQPDLSGQVPNRDAVGLVKQKGLVKSVAEVFSGSIFKSKRERLNEYIGALLETGTDYDTAVKIGLREVDGSGVVDSMVRKIAGPTEDGLNEKEREAIASIKKWENIDKLFFVLDVSSLGASKPVTTAIRTGLRGAETAVRGASKIDEPVHDILNAIQGEGDLAKRAAANNRFRDWAGDQILKLREVVEDDWIRIKKLQQSEGAKVVDDADPYTAEINMAGRIGSRLEEGRDAANKIDLDILDTAKRSNVEDTQLLDEVNDYLVALHAGERIAAVGENALPMTVARADEIIAAVEKSPLRDDIKRIAQEVKDLHNQTLDILKEGKVIDDKLYKTLRDRYKQHVPLQRVFEETEDIGGALSASGADVRSTGIKRAKGSNRAVADIMENVVYNFEQAVVRAEKNRVANAFARFVRNNPQIEGIKIRRPKAVGEAFADANGVRQPLMEQTNDPKVFQFFEDGKRTFIEFDDPHLAAALRGINAQHLPGLLKGVNAFTRFYSGLATRFNPEFALTNKLRDLQEAVIYAAAQGQGAGALKVALDPKELGAGSMNTVRKFLKGKRDPRMLQDADVQLYQQMLKDGGSTGGYLAQTVGDVRLDIASLRKLNRSKPRQAATRIIETVDNFNKIFEESTRLSVYKTALANGMSRPQAARMAKEATINFNKMGTGGPVINALWMFSNASIQGSAKFLRAMKNPKVLGATALTVGSSVFAINEYNDSVDPEWRNVVTKWDRTNGLPVMLPFADEGDATPYIVIPVSWGIKPMKVAFDTLSDVMNGHATDVGEATAKIAQSLVEGYNPVGGTDVWSAIMPTIGDVPNEIFRNKAWYGGKIAPDSDKYAPDSMRFFSDIKDNATGRLFTRASRGLSGMGVEISPETMDYAYNQYIGGAGRTVSKTVNTVNSLISGETPEAKDVPFVSRFFRTRTQEEVGAGSEQSAKIDDLLTEQSRERLVLLEQAEEAFATLEASQPEDKQRIWKEIKSTDEDLARKILDIRAENERGLTYIDRKVLRLGVENGERAKYIFSELEEIKDPEERNRLWQEYKEKKLITEDVNKQIQYMKSQLSTGQ